VGQFVEEASGGPSNDCRLSRRVESLSSQLFPEGLLKARSLVMLVFRASTDSSTIGVNVINTICANSYRCDLKRILIQVLGMKQIKKLNLRFSWW
jgi:hypothetical protein